MWTRSQGKEIAPQIQGALCQHKLDVDQPGPGCSWTIGGDNAAKPGIDKSMKFCQIELSLYFGVGGKTVSIYCGTGREAKKLNLKKFQSYPQLRVVIHRYPMGYPQMRTILEAAGLYLSREAISWLRLQPKRLQPETGCRDRCPDRYRLKQMVKDVTYPHISPKLDNLSTHTLWVIHTYPKLLELTNLRTACTRTGCSQ